MRIAFHFRGSFLKGIFMNYKRTGQIAFVLLKALVSNHGGSWSVLGSNKEHVALNIAQFADVSVLEATDFVDFVEDSLKRHGQKVIPRVMTDRQFELADMCTKYWILNEGFAFDQRICEQLTETICTRDNDIQGAEFLEYWGGVLIWVVARTCLPEGTDVTVVSGAN